MRKVCFSKNPKEDVAMKNECKSEATAEVWADTTERAVQIIKLITSALSTLRAGP